MSKWTNQKKQTYSPIFNPQSLLKYYKTILEKVSFDPALFTKEYHKAKRDLGTVELRELVQWMHQRGLTGKLQTNQ